MQKRPWTWRDSLAVRLPLADAVGLILVLGIVAGCLFLALNRNSRSGGLCATLYAQAHTRADTLAVDDQDFGFGRRGVDNSCGALRRLGMVPGLPRR